MRLIHFVLHFTSLILVLSRAWSRAWSCCFEVPLGSTMLITSLQQVWEKHLLGLEKVGNMSGIVSVYNIKITIDIMICINVLKVTQSKFLILE